MPESEDGGMHSGRDRLTATCAEELNVYQFMGCTLQVNFWTPQVGSCPTSTQITTIAPHEGILGRADRQTYRLTKLHCAPSRGWSTRNMINHHVHHLISTKLQCAPPKCMPVQNYIVDAGRRCTMRVDGAQHMYGCINLAPTGWNHPMAKTKSGISNGHYLWQLVNPTHFKTVC